MARRRRGRRDGDQRNTGMSRGGDAPRAGRGEAPRQPRAPRWTRASVRNVLIVLMGAAVVGVAAHAFRYVLPGPLRTTELPPPRQAPPESRVARADFVGADRCAACHRQQYDAWRTSTHGRAGGTPEPGVVIAAFDGRPIRFRDAVVIPRVRGSTYEFLVQPDGDSARAIRVDGVIGGGHMAGGGTQGFVTRWPDSTYRFVAFDWSRAERAWFCNTSSRAGHGWVPITPALRLADCGDWPPARVLGDVPRWANCQGCHASQLRVDGPGQAARFTSLAINCEACHGPARRHVELAESGRLTAADIGMTPLATLGKDASLAVCFQCHAVKDQLREGFVSGDSLALFYSIGLPSLGERPLAPDGHVRTFAYQEAHRYSDCYVNGGMTCTSCHDPHTQGYRSVTGTSLPGRFDDRQCTSCHPSKATDPAAHTHHRAGSDASRCTTCHMPYLQEPETTDPVSGAAYVRYQRSDHSIAIPRPVADSSLGLRDACASCHADRGATRLESDLHRLWGPGKPVPPQIAAQLDVARAVKSGADVWPAGGLLVEGADGARPHVAATVAGVGRYLELVPGPGASLPVADAQRLRTLATDPDVDTRALALATLHLTASDAAARRVLVRALVREAPDDYGLRIRWALALGFKGDQWAEAGRPMDAAAAYRLALEVLPAHAGLWNSLGNALRGAGDLSAAVAAYDAALRARADWPLPTMNRGITRLALGDTAGGLADLGATLRADPGEPMAWFNTANVVLARGGLDSAAVLLRRAVALDASMTDAHFQLARIALVRRDAAGAYAELRRGLAFDSSNAAARDLARQIGASLARP